LLLRRRDEEDICPRSQANEDQEAERQEEVMDITPILAQQMMKAQGTKPVKLPVRSAPRGMRATGYKTQQINGKWVVVPTGFRKGKEDPALRPRVSVNPLNG
jgi:hypothetical protein